MKNTALSVGLRVADKKTGEELGVVTRVIKAKNEALVKHTMNGVERHPMSNLVIIRRVRAAKADAPAEEKDRTMIPLTREIQIQVFNNNTNPPQVFCRGFETAVHARDFLLTTFDPKGIDGRTAYAAADKKVTIQSNYDIKKILDKKDPQEDLPAINVQRKKEELRSRQPVVVGKPGGILNGLSPSLPQSSRGVKSKSSSEKGTRSEKKSSSGLIPLKQICADLELDPREARMKLRKAKEGQLPIAHEAQGRWEWQPDQVDAVKAFLTGTAEKPLGENVKKDDAKKKTSEKPVTKTKGKSAAVKTPMKGEVLKKKPASAKKKR